MHSCRRASWPLKASMGWTQRKDRPPGKTILTKGLQRLLDHTITEAILQDEIARYGQLPPRIAALLGRRRTA